MAKRGDALQGIDVAEAFVMTGQTERLLHIMWQFSAFVTVILKGTRQLHHPPHEQRIFGPLTLFRY